MHVFVARCMVRSLRAAKRAARAKTKAKVKVKAKAKSDLAKGPEAKKAVGHAAAWRTGALGVQVWSSGSGRAWR